MNFRLIKIMLFLFTLTAISRTTAASFEAKVILKDVPNKLIAIDNGSEQGLTENLLFCAYKEGREIARIWIFKVSRQVAICEIKNLSLGEDININDRIILLTEKEKSDLKINELPSGINVSPNTEEDLKTSAKKIADEETIKRKLNKILIKERAEGIAEAIKSEKELEKMKQEASEIVKEVIEEKKKEKHIVSFNFKEVDIKNALNIISREAGANIVVPPEFPVLAINLSLNDIELEDALDLILGMVNYAFIKENNMYKVVKSEEVEKKAVYKTFAPRYAQAEKLKKLLSDSNLLSEEGKLVVDSRSNKIVVIDLPKNMEKIEEVITQIDVKPRQVTIEAKIVDVSLTDTEKLGIEWTWIKDAAGVPAQTAGFTVDSLSEGKGFFKYGTLSASQIATVFEALMKREHANVLSKPTITTLSNEEAKINVTRKLAYRTDTATTATGGSTTTAINWQEKEVGIILSVTPYINDTGDIIMKIEPTASLLQEYIGTAPNQYPVIMSRSATTQVMVKDGETLVIGGLITQEMRDTKSGIPLLSDIPILGIPFQKKTKSLVNTELIIFITPHIVTDGQENNSKAQGG